MIFIHGAGACGCLWVPVQHRNKRCSQKKKSDPRWRFWMGHDGRDMMGGKSDGTISVDISWPFWTVFRVWPFQAVTVWPCALPASKTALVSTKFPERTALGTVLAAFISWKFITSSSHVRHVLFFHIFQVTRIKSIFTLSGKLRVGPWK